MPRARRNTKVSLTNTSKKTRSHKADQISAVHTALDKYSTVYVFSVGDMRNSALKEVRNDWKEDGRLFMGRNKVIGTAFGLDEGSEYKEGLAPLSKYLEGNVGIFLTSSDEAKVTDYFSTFKRPDFARCGQRATETKTLPLGPVLSVETGLPFAHSLEPALRALGLDTKLVNGTPETIREHTVCVKGKKLTSEQAQVLKLLGVRMAVFKVSLLAKWEASTGSVTELEAATTKKAEEADVGGESGDDDEALGPVEIGSDLEDEDM